MYHSVGGPVDPYTVSATSFARQVRALAAAHPVARLTDVPALLRGGLRRRHIVLTFDDALLDCFEHALPVLEQLGAPCTIFVPTGFIGGHNDWDAGTEHYVRKPVMTAAQLRQLVGGGLVTLGSHSVTHARMSRLSPARMREEAMTSRRRLEDLLGIAVTTFAYPYGQLGDFSWATTEVLREAEYDLAVTTHWGVANRSADLLRLRRVFFLEHDDGAAVRRKAGRWHAWRGVKERVGHMLRSWRAGSPSGG